MKDRLIFVLVGTAILTVLCVLPYASMRGWLAPAQAEQQPAATMAQEATRTPQASATPQNTITPAPLYEATIAALQAANNVTELEAARVRLEVARVEYQAVEKDGADRVRAAEIAAHAQAQSHQRALELEQARRETAAEVEKAKQATIAAWADYERAAAERLRAEQAGRDAWARYAMTAAIAIIAAGFVLVVWRGRERVTDDDELTDYEPRPEWMPQPPIIQVNAPNEVMQYVSPITPAQARALIDAGGLLGPLSFRKVQAFGITRAAWNEIRLDLVPTFAEYDKAGAIILNMAGTEMVRKTAPPLTHSPARVPVQGNSADTGRHDTAQHTPDTAEGEV
jgi:hypothetical protein